jgi:hypothetical protein
MSNNIDINKYINDKDLIKFCNMYGFNNKYIHNNNDINSIDELFSGKNYFAIIFIENKDSNIGHWVVLKNIDDINYEYFDCLADDNERLLELFKLQKQDCTLTCLNKPLMKPDGILCGKYCISYILSGDLELNEYARLLSSNKLVHPDEYIDKLYRVDYSDNILKQDYF